MTSKKKVLLTEDDAGMRDAIQILFEQAGYEVMIFSSGDCILNNEFELPDIFILDKQLSGVDGLDICRYLKSQERSRHIPVLMVSANPHIMKLAAHAQADDALEKPFPVKSLLAKVEKLLA